MFAAWVSNKQLDKTFIQQFNAANKWGVEHIDEVVKQYPDALINLKYYFNDCISYQLDDEKKRGMKLFLEMISGKVTTV